MKWNWSQSASNRENIYTYASWHWIFAITFHLGWIESSIFPKIIDRIQDKSSSGFQKCYCLRESKNCFESTHFLDISKDNYKKRSKNRSRKMKLSRRSSTNGEENLVLWSAVILNLSSNKCLISSFHTQTHNFSNMFHSRKWCRLVFSYIEILH